MQGIVGSHNLQEEIKEWLVWNGFQAFLKKSPWLSMYKIEVNVMEDTDRCAICSDFRKYNKL